MNAHYGQHDGRPLTGALERRIPHALDCIFPARRIGVTKVIKTSRLEQAEWFLERAGETLHEAVNIVI